MCVCTLMNRDPVGGLREQHCKGTHMKITSYMYMYVCFSDQLLKLYSVYVFYDIKVGHWTCQKQQF